LAASNQDSHFCPIVLLKKHGNRQWTASIFRVCGTVRVKQEASMRDLFETELNYVSGAGSSPSGPSGCGCSPSGPSTGRKGNNGFGNGSDTPNTRAPGNSGGTPGSKDYSTVR
jgi:hypothetical protein